MSVKHAPCHPTCWQCLRRSFFIERVLCSLAVEKNFYIHRPTFEVLLILPSVQFWMENNFLWNVRPIINHRCLTYSLTGIRNWLSRWAKRINRLVKNVEWFWHIRLERIVEFSTIINFKTIANAKLLRRLRVFNKNNAVSS